MSDKPHLRELRELLRQERAGEDERARLMAERDEILNKRLTHYERDSELDIVERKRDKVSKRLQKLEDDIRDSFCWPEGLLAELDSLELG